MNIEKHLILVKGEDKTEAISSCKYQNGKWHITFEKGKTYSYNYLNVVWLKNPVISDSAATIVYENSHPLSGVKMIYDFGEYIRICFETGYMKVYPSREITVEQSHLKNPRAHDCFAYLKQLAEKTSIKDEDNQSLLKKQYDKITFISPSSVLAKYLSPSVLDPSKPKEQMPIFPFGFNLSQKQATEKALTEQLSVIEGPPGTGKTQTILNIIANAIMNDKTVAVVSGNNSATANVIEKLQKYDVDFIAAYLGNRANKEKFVAGQTQTYPDMTAWSMGAESYRELKTTLIKSGQELGKMLKAKNEAALLKQELSQLLVEKEYFLTYYNETNEKIPPYKSLYRHKAKTIMTLWLDFQNLAETDEKVTFKYKLKNLLRYGIVNFSFYNNPHETVIALFQKLYYERRIKEIEEKILALNKLLESYHFDHAMQEYSEMSMKIFKAKLAEKYFDRKVRRSFTRESLRKEFAALISEYPVILSTTYSLRSCVSDNYLFDHVIMDEASQVDIVTGALALSCARNAVIVGDLKQLPNVVAEATAEETRRIYQKFSLDNAYQYEAGNSMLASITKLFANIPRTLLIEHYRCHPKIIGFCNQKFYNNELIVLTEENGRDKPLVVYKTAKGNHARNTYNQRQIDVIMQEVIPQQGLNDTEQSLGIMSPYRLQTDKLIEAVGDNNNIEIDTVHKYQGRERDIVILTTVANQVNEFIDQLNLVNVAVSRAVDKLIVVVSDNDVDENSNIGDLVKYIEYNNFEIINSNIYSVFDLLYHSYSKQIFEQMKNRKKVSEYESENLINAVIEKVLENPEYSNLDHVMHQPLKMLIRNPEKLNEAEARFAMNILTHTDFVIFNKLNKMPVLVVEVDGYAFHANNPRQMERDKMKDTILQKYEIPILRLRTNESGEEARLQNKLEQILKPVAR